MRESEHEHRLFARMTEGDSQVLRVLFECHAQRALTTARRILGDWNDAHDVVQDTFIELWQRAADFKAHRGSAAGWITTIARSRAIDRQRARARTNRALEAAAVDLQPVDASSPDEVEDHRRDREILVQAINALPPNQRAAIHAAYFEELTQAEVSLQTGIPLGTVKLQRRTALAALSRLFRTTRRAQLARRPAATRIAERESAGAVGLGLERIDHQRCHPPAKKYQARG
jgi:RNA polymerase sigma-70 factor (ECF subfamily)